MELITRGLLTQALAAASRAGVFAAMVDGATTAEEIAQRTGADRDALKRLLRALVALRAVEHTPDGRYIAAPLGRELASGPVRDMYGLLATLAWDAWGALDVSLRSGEPAFRHVRGDDLFPYLTTHPDERAIFQAAMAGQSRMQAEALVEAIDLVGVRRVVDVGGGRGTLLAALLRANPGLRGTLFDVPEVVATAEELRSPDIADRAEVVAGDFFAEVPPGADRYILKLVIHDWDDERALRILETVRRAMPDHGRVLVVEHLLPEDDEYQHAVWLDLNMLVLTGGRERTGAEYGVLLDRAGLRTLRIHPTRGGMSVVEAEPAPG